MAEKKVTYITPIGIAVWPKLDKPDVWTPKKAKEPKVRYTCNIKFEDPKVLAKVRKDIERLTAGMDTGENENSPFKEDKDGNVSLFAFSGPKFKPPVFDSKNRRAPDGIVIGGGSKIRLDVTLNGYDGFGGGVNLYINSVQLIEHVEPSFGKSNFDEVDDGFEVEEDAAASAPATAGDADDSDEIPF